MLKLVVGFVLISLALQAAGQTCTNICKYGADGNGDDGGPGREYSDCAFGMDCVHCGPRNQAPPPAPQPFCTNQLNSGLLYSRDFPLPCTSFTMYPTVCAPYSAARTNINVTASAASTQVNIIVSTPTPSATTAVEPMLSTSVFANAFAASSFFGVTATSAPTIASGPIVVTAIPPIMSAGLSVPNAGAGSTLTLAIAIGVGLLVGGIAVTILVIRCRSRNGKSDMPATRSGAFAKRLARRRASRAAKRAATAAEWRLINEALAASASSRSVDSGSPSVPCPPSSPSTRHATLLSRYVERLRALGRERLRKTHLFCRLRSYLRRRHRHRKMILRKAQAVFSPSPPSKALAGVTARLAVVDHKVTDDPVPDLRVRPHRVSVARLRGGMQATAPDADAATAAMSSAMSELDVAAATPISLASSSELIDRLRLRFHLRRSLQLRRHLRRRHQLVELDPEVKRELSELDHDLLEAFGRGDIALVRSSWLLAQLALQPDYRIVRRQDLKPVGGISPHLEPEEAKRLLLKGERAIGAFSFGWPISGNPDPTGHRIEALWRALQERSDIEAFFWDFPSLYQNSDQSPRTEEQERAFKRGLGVMGHIYASAIGTTVLQLKELPLRPPEYDGKLCLFDLAPGVDGAAIKAALVAYGDIVSCTLGRFPPATVCFTTHAAAQAAKRAAAQLAHISGGVDTLFNERSYDGRHGEAGLDDDEGRGWCVFESAVSGELILRLSVVPRLKAELDKLPPKMLQVRSGHSLEPVDLSAGRLETRVADVIARIEGATFTAGADKARVIGLYKKYVDQITVALQRLLPKMLASHGATAAPPEPLPQVDAPAAAPLRLAEGQPLLLLSWQGSGAGGGPRFGVVDATGGRVAAAVTGGDDAELAYDRCSQAVLPWRPPAAGWAAAFVGDARALRDLVEPARRLADDARRVESESAVRAVGERAREIADGAARCNTIAHATREAGAAVQSCVDAAAALFSNGDPTQFQAALVKVRAAVERLQPVALEAALTAALRSSGASGARRYAAGQPLTVRTAGGWRDADVATVGADGLCHGLTFLEGSGEPPATLTLHPWNHAPRELPHAAYEVMRDWWARSLRANHAHIPDALTGKRLDALQQCVAISVDAKGANKPAAAPFGAPAAAGSFGAVPSPFGGGTASAAAPIPLEAPAPLAFGTAPKNPFGAPAAPAAGSFSAPAAAPLPGQRKVDNEWEAKRAQAARDADAARLVRSAIAIAVAEVDAAATFAKAVIAAAVAQVEKEAKAQAEAARAEASMAAGPAPGGQRKVYKAKRSGIPTGVAAPAAPAVGLDPTPAAPGGLFSNNLASGTATPTSPATTQSLLGAAAATPQPAAAGTAPAPSSAAFSFGGGLFGGGGAAAPAPASGGGLFGGGGKAACGLGLPGNSFSPAAPVMGGGHFDPFLVRSSPVFGVAAAAGTGNIAPYQPSPAPATFGSFGAAPAGGARSPIGAAPAGGGFGAALPPLGGSAAAAPAFGSGAVPTFDAIAMPKVNASTSFGATLAFGGLCAANAGAAGFGGAAAAAAGTQATVIRDAHSLTAWLLAQHGARLEGGPTEGPLAALLTAGPASGKTTLLSQVVTIALQDERTELVPILVKVQVLQRRLLEAPDAFASAWNYIDAYLRLEHEASRPALYRMLRQAMMARRALLLLDGLDEAGAKRADIERHVVEVLAPQGHVLLCTSRPAGVDEARFAAFRRLSLAPLSDEQQERALEQRLGAERAAALLTYVRDVMPRDDTGQKVTSNPLMLSMVAAVYELRQGVGMPRTVAELYATASDAMLARGGVTSPELARLLQRIFFEAHVAQRHLF